MWPATPALMAYSMGTRGKILVSEAHGQWTVMVGHLEKEIAKCP